ncbi:MAG TPA: GNAT family N-acetyltransferase [Geminicoccaceae bacterium]|nr:GNAT family N-acetyltransferase [Geminicoccaceae bacterium]
MRVRPAASDDLDALAAVECAGFQGDRTSRRSLRRLLARPSALTLVAVAGDRIVGYAMLLFRHGSRAARLYSLVRLPEVRGHGIGEALLREAERAAAGRGATEMRLEVRPDNARARSLYERHGFAAFSRVADYYEDNSEALRMRKSLIGAAPR